ncbi:(2R,3R)-2,3-butanediol dehydrogenase [Mortierella sp. AD094]|nr:(2R,3R)-2,3-butanediol dehydrogenase [Mortierella sp. AD094]
MTYTLTNPDHLVVVVTGCDTGFGAEIVRDLYMCGKFTIYATCLTAQAVETYQAKKSTRLRSLQVDVTEQTDVNELRSKVEAECPQGIYCVFNNAGVYAGGFFDFSTEDDFQNISKLTNSICPPARIQRIMDVNYMGIIRITKALLPSLRTYAKSRHLILNGKSLPRARLISITSMAGRSSPPGHGGYSASKHAAESILDALRIELSPWEIDVSMIEPFYAKTPLVANGRSVLEASWNRASPATRLMYGPQLLDVLISQSERVYKRAMPSKWVVDAAVNTIKNQSGASKARILVGFWWVRILIRLQERSPEWILDWITRFVMKRLGTWPADPFLLKNSARQ